jgi:hypothetical protein
MALYRALLCVVCYVGLAAPCFAQAATDPGIAELRRTIEAQQKLILELTARVAALEASRRAADSGELEADVPPIEIPQAPFVRPSGGSAFAPDLAVIGRHGGTFLVPRGYDGRNRFELNEIEITLQQPLYTGMNFFATLAGGSDAGFAVGIEEAYASLSRPLKMPFDAVVGKRRVQFGKLNALHPHLWRHVDMPAPLAAFFGEEGLFGNGASVNYTLPLRSVFANVEVGLWKNDGAHSHEQDEVTEGEEPGHVRADPGIAIAGDMPVGRLWVSKALGAVAEVEVGGSHTFGRAVNGDRIRLTGADLTLRSYPSAHGRVQFQAEALWHSRRTTHETAAWHNRSGHYALLTYAPDQYYEYGVRYDNTRYPWPIEGREQSIAFVLSNRLTEATLVRLQLKLGDRTSDVFLPARKGYKEVFLQFIWGAGSHKHSLQ